MTGPVRGEFDPPEASLRLLRTRLMAVAARRVAAEVVEDLVQEALGVIVTRGVQVGSFELVDGLPPLVWSLQVMRNVIGNWYQRTRTVQRRRVDGFDFLAEPAVEPTPLDALASEDATRAIHAAIEALDPPCAVYLGRLARGGSPADMARDAQLDRAALYKRLYRCRVKLRAALLRLGILA